MSRLDDELRLAPQREEPSTDFAERVVRAAAAAPAPKRTWWAGLISLFASPKVRWVAAGVAVSLLLLLALQYQRRERNGSEGPSNARVAPTEEKQPDRLPNSAVTRQE